MPGAKSLAGQKLPIWQVKNSAKTLCPGIIVANQKSMKRALLSTQSMQRDLHTAACHLWAQKGHHQCESASSTCLAHVLWVVPRLAWPNHLRDWNEHHQSGMQDLALKKSLFLRALVKLSNYSCNLKKGEKEVAPAPIKQQECWNSKTLNNSHTRTHSRHPAGRSPQTPAMERPPSATPELNMVPATHPAPRQRNPHPFYPCSGTRIILSSNIHVVRRPLYKWQIVLHSPTCDYIILKAFPTPRPKDFRMETKCHEWSWPVLTKVGNLMHPSSKPQNNGQCFNHISHCYDMIWDTNPTPTSSQATKHNARRCEFPELCANLRGHPRSSQHPGDIQVTWSGDIWVATPEVDQLDSGQCQHRQPGLSNGMVGGCGIETWTWKATTQHAPSTVVSKEVMTTRWNIY